MIAREIPAGVAGPVRLELRLGWPRRLVVSGSMIPTVRIDRVETPRERARREKRAAKGKTTKRVDDHPGSNDMGPYTARDTFPRKPGSVALTVADAPAELAPRRVFMFRATYGARATVAGRRYLLLQTSWFRARVRRDGQRVARLRRVRKSRRPYEDDVRWEPGADPLDIAMTHALASAYRVGSPGFLYNLTAGVFYTILIALRLLS